MEITERFRAAPNDRKSSLYFYMFFILLCLGATLYIFHLNVASGVASLLCVMALAVGVVGHELYRKRWGTFTIMALPLIFAVLLPMGGFIKPWTKKYFLMCGSAMLGTFLVWRERAGECEHYLVPLQSKRIGQKIEHALHALHPPTPFHVVLTRHFLGQTDSAATWLAEIYDASLPEAQAENAKITALYLEMNGFEFNTNRWFLNGFALTLEPSELIEDLENTVGDYVAAPDIDFTLTGMEDLQKAFADTNLAALLASKTPEDQRRLEVVNLAAAIITIRMHELVAAAHRLAKRRGHPVGNIRVFAGAHDSPAYPLCSPP